MISVSEYQVARMRGDRIKIFAKELAEDARTRHEDKCAELSDEDLLSGLEKEITAAKAIGLHTRGELKRFSDLAMTFGFGFSEKENWARGTFANEEHEPAERLLSVEKTAVFVFLRAG